MNDDWILLKNLADELHIPADHPDRWSAWTALGFRPTRLIVKSKTGVVRRWAVTVEQAERLREVHASALTIN